MAALLYIVRSMVSTLAHQSRMASTTAFQGVRSVAIGCASGFWGDTPTSVGQLVENGGIVS